MVEMKGVPGPYPLALGDRKLSRFLLRLNEVLIGISRGLFAYQIYMIVQPHPSTEHLLQIAREHFTTRPARQAG